VTDDDIAFADVVELQRLLARKAISSLELTNLYLARLETYGDAYGAVVTILHDRARREARRADRERAAGRVRGPLHGIPYGAKDLLATPDAPTTWGAAPYRRQRFDFDATVIRRLTDAGAVLLAKLAMVELAGGFGYNDADASFTGPGRTPWNAAFWSGGSSSGSGAAVAAGLVGFAIGSETCGSILFPATACGIAGLRPTYGRVSRHGAMALCWSLDKLGPMARSARDTDVVLRAIAGADPLDPTSVERPFPAARRRPRIAILRNATKGCMPAVARNFNASVKVLASFCDVTTGVALPAFPYDAAVETIVRAEGAAAFRDLIESGRSKQLRQTDDRLGGYVGYATPAIDYIDAQRQRTLMTAALHDAFGAYDAVVAPTLPTVTYPVGAPFDATYREYDGNPNLIAPGNLAGLPALAIPNGFGEHGLPTSLSFLGTPFAESRLTAIGKRYQQLTTTHRERPPCHPERSAESAQSRGSEQYAHR
jgi:aspartyl-tRNA(Asn)/glutamyl-tRNA(Gln) amidotransferase subunit A